LYFRIGKHVIDMAMRLKALFAEKGIRFYLDSPTNQQFVVLDNDTLARLQSQVAVTVWEPFDDTHTVVRFVTGWTTTQEELDALAALL
jgi:threonine aldolase